MKRILILLAAFLPLAVTAQSIFPLKLSANRRHFETQHGKPFLYHADTGWQIFTKLTTGEAAEYLRFAYLPELQSVTVDFSFLNGNAFAVTFLDPRTGQTIKIETQNEQKVRRIPSPPAEDLVLMVRGLEPR
jgi:hypothetical protein